MNKEVTDFIEAFYWETFRSRVGRPANPTPYDMVAIMKQLQELVSGSQGEGITHVLEGLVDWSGLAVKLIRE